jgi:hypothetical protein
MSQVNQIEQEIQNLITLAHAISAGGEQAGVLADLLEEEVDIPEDIEEKVISTLETIELTTGEFQDQVELLLKHISNFEGREVN